MADAFETLLKVARAQRDAASQAVNAATASLDDANRRIAELEAAQNDAAFDDELSFAAGSYLRELTRRKQRLAAQLPQLEQRLSASRGELMDAFGECKKMEFVQERQRLRAAAEERRREGAALDELAQRRAGSD
jgi:flagellar export protein FliJ